MLGQPPTNIKPRAAIIITLLLVVRLFVAQNFTSRAFSIDQGLPDAYIYAVVQDKAGYLWVATAKGLVKFDGQVFSKYKLSLNEEDYIFSGTLDKDNTLWFGTFNGKIFSLAPGAAQLKQLTETIPGSVNKITPAGKGGVYFISIGNGIYYLNNGKLLNIPSSRDYFINSLEETGSDKLLLCTSEGLVSLNLKSNVAARILGFPYGTLNIQKLKKKTNTYLVSTREEGLYELELDDNGEALVIRSMRQLSTDIPKEVSAFYFDENDNEIYFGAKDETFSVLNTLTNRKTTFNDHDYLGLANSVFADSEGNIWASTTGRGLYRFYKTDYDFVSANNKPVYAIAQDQQGNTYYGTSTGIEVSQAGNELLKTVEQVGNKKLGRINTLYVDGENKLWIGTESNGLFVVELPSLLIQQVEFSTIENIGVNAITGDMESGEVYVSTNLDGAYIYRNGKLQYHFSVLNSLLHNNVYFAARGGKGKVYYATHNTAFNFSINDQVYEINVDNNSLITDYNVFARDAKGNLAIATDGDGVYYLNDTVITPFPFNNKLESKFCSGVAYDNDYNLWITQRYNIYKYYAEDSILKRMELGFNTMSFFNPNAVCKTKKGDLLFGTNKNVVRVKYSRRKALLPQARVLKVALSDSLIDFSKPLHLSYGRYDIGFEFSALCLKNSEQVLFSYKLEGRDNNWSEPSRTRFVEFSNLSEGDYRFMVKAFNSDGFAGKEPFVYQFSIDAPFWKKAGFWITFVIVLIMLVYAIVKWRTAALVREKLRLERLVEEKTVEIRKEKEIVEMNSKVIEAQHHEITQSINYAKRIQEAILPVFNHTGKYMPDIMVYYIPKDIVSGDFYWHAVKDGRFLLAACDCTGHGVPGAFMSLIGSTLLNKIVLDKGVVEPQNILSEIDKEISVSLKQESNEVRDGMETAVCSFDFSAMKLYFAGAKRPLWLFRKTENQYTLNEYSPNKFPIGGFADVKEKSFTAHDITLAKDDTLYMFSDGIIDQFDGANKKRLSTKRVREYLSSIVGLPFEQQENKIHEFFNNWKQENAQTDDVLLIGIKIR